MKFKEFCEKIKGANFTVYGLLPEHSKRQWKEEFNQINKAEQLRNNAQVKFTVLRPSYRAPSKSMFGNTYSLFATKDVTISPGEVVTVGTGLTITIKSDNHIAVIGPDCNLSFKGLGCLNAGDFITAAHKDDEIKIVLINHTKEPITIERNSRVAKLVIIHTENIPLNISYKGEDADG